MPWRTSRFKKRPQIGGLLLCFLQLFSLCNLQHNGTFHALAEEPAAVVVNACNVAGSVISVGCTAAGAVESGPAVVTFLARINIAPAEVFLHICVCYAIPYVAHKVFFVAYKLMAGVKITPRCYSKVLCTGAAACDSLVDARAVGQVQHIMIEGYWMTFFFSFEHFLG